MAIAFFVFLRAQVISLDAVSLVGGCRIWFVLYYIVRALVHYDY